MTDPFAGLEASTNNNDNTDTVSKKENTSMENINEDQNKLTVTLKGGAGFDAPWVVVHAANAADALETLNDEDLKTVLERAKKIGAFFAGGTGGAPAQAPASNGQPTGATQAPGGQTPPEGYVFKSGISKKNGRPWQAFMPIDRNSGMETIWLNADGSRRS